MNDTTRFSINYRIAQTFDRRVRLSTHWARLRPAPHTRASIAAFTLAIDADPHFVNWVRDPFENHLARLDFHEPLQHIELNMELIVDLTPVNPFDFLIESDAHDYPFDYARQLRKELTPYLRLGSPKQQLNAWLKSLKPKPGYVVDTLGELNTLVYKRIKCEGGTKPCAVDVEALLKRGTGTAWEIAWLLTLSFRSCGLAARFVSGLKLDRGLSKEIPDHASLHAWSEVFLPGAGWVGLDPSAGIFTAEGHIPLATAPEPLRAVPLIGYFEACEMVEQIEIGVRRLEPHPDNSELTPAQWRDINLVAQHIDKTLAHEKIKATAAQSLSFVATAHTSDPEWSIAAMGQHKRRYADNLMKRLQQRIAPGGVIQIGQGEWFGGESLPRWRLTCLFRKDGTPCWQDTQLLGTGQERDDNSVNDALQFMKLLADVLRIDSKFVVAAYEDLLHELWMNRNHLGYAPDPQELNDPVQRQQLADRLSMNRGTPTAHVLPLRWDAVTEQWASGSWKFRRKALYLIPGSSPPGFRLPLGSLPRNLDAVVAQDPERCQFEPREVLPALHGEFSARLSSIPVDTEEDPKSWSADDETAGAAPRTALCIDVREGRLHLFLPPLTHLEHYLELIAAIEAVTAKLQTLVVLEGYEPPYDARFQRFVIEPDAGVLKLTLPEAASWQTAIHHIDSAYEEAAALGLYGERQTEDGHSMPPGGGAEITIGGDEPASSPFLQRPELLRSFITYWQAHPCLSYLFAGRIVGASGDAPRVDEGRDDALYELDMALKRIPDGLCDKPWTPDRILRHLLTDPTGDMRNAEIRVDQLYPPERSSTRLGRIVVRSFETPPTQRLAALQWLLVRGLLASFAARPQHASLINWRGALHDRFMLPEWLWQDLISVIDNLNETGIPMRAEWFAPFMDLRFPAIGKVQLGDLSLELRTAHENWTLLAEEVAAGGISRFIDSANDRIQIKLSGAIPDRYAVLCNDRRIPLCEVGQYGEFVAGVRYKASNPPATLHPTIAPERSLVFDVVDTWTGRVIGGCTYLPPVPGIWGAAGLPQIIPFEAMVGEEAQRLLPPVEIPPWFSKGGRFLPHGSGRDRLTPAAESVNPRFPNLLDLTR